MAANEPMQEWWDFLPWEKTPWNLLKGNLIQQRLWKQNKTRSGDTVLNITVLQTGKLRKLGSIFLSSSLAFFHSHVQRNLIVIQEKNPHSHKNIGLHVASAAREDNAGWSLVWGLASCNFWLGSEPDKKCSSPVCRELCSQSFIKLRYFFLFLSEVNCARQALGFK